MRHHNQDVLDDIYPMLKALNQAHTEQEASHGCEDGNDTTLSSPLGQESIIINVYIVVDPAVDQNKEDERTVESTIQASREEDTTPASVETVIPTPRTTKHNSFGLISNQRVFSWMLCTLCVLAMLAGVFASLVPLLTGTVTVTIIPKATTLTTASTITIVTTGTPNAERLEIAGRFLSSLILTLTRTVPTTGTGHQEAQLAHGTITFYNALLAIQTVPKGTLLMGADGIEIVTDQEAVIPAGSLSTNGQVTVSAHALQVGPAGNIAARDIYGPCCRADVFAQNAAAFTGGESARTFPMVTEQDIDGVEATLKASLTETTQGAFQTQLQPTEALLTPVPCTASVNSNHAKGGEASLVTVTLREACTGVAYDQQALRAQVIHMLIRQANRHLGAGYAFSGNVEARIIRATVTDTKQGTVRLTVQGTGKWAYQFSEEQLRVIAKTLAGKSQRQATAIMLLLPGVSQVLLHVSGLNMATLPQDPGHIHVLVLYQLV
jgi:hypothetical protein